MQEPWNNCPAKQNVTNAHWVRHGGRSPSVQTLQNEAVYLLWSHIQLAHRKLSTQHDAIISMLATQLTRRIKAPRPIPRQKGGRRRTHVKLQGSTPAQRSTSSSTNRSTTSAQVMPHGEVGAGWDQEDGDERQGEWAQYSLLMHVDLRVANGWEDGEIKEKTKILPVWGSSLQVPLLWSQTERRKRQRGLPSEFVVHVQTKGQSKKFRWGLNIPNVDSQTTSKQC